MRLLGRDIKKTIIIDNLRENFDSTCPNNGLEIESWYGIDMADTELKRLIPFLKQIALNQEKDVRPIIEKYRDNYEKYLEDSEKSKGSGGEKASENFMMKPRGSKKYSSIFELNQL
jgi:phage terminase small subunit